MKYLIILLLFITSCTDKKQITADPIVVEPITPKAPSSPKITKLSYENDLDLMLVSTSFEDTWDNILDKREEGLGYYAIYWDSYNNLYYTVTNDIVLLYPIPVTNTNFVYTIDKTKQFEPIFHLAMKEVFTNTGAPLLYIGSLSPLERVYLDPTNQVYYIKYLAPWDNSIYTISYGEKEVTNTRTLPIYPYVDPDFKHDWVPNISFTNSNDELFILYSFNFPLLYKGLITNE